MLVAVGKTHIKATECGTNRVAEKVSDEFKRIGGGRSFLLCVLFSSGVLITDGLGRESGGQSNPIGIVEAVKVESEIIYLNLYFSDCFLGGVEA